jgi:hypothetical protein
VLPATRAERHTGKNPDFHGWARRKSVHRVQTDRRVLDLPEGYEDIGLAPEGAEFDASRFPFKLVGVEDRGESSHVRQMELESCRVVFWHGGECHQLAPDAGVLSPYSFGSKHFSKGVASPV